MAMDTNSPNYCRSKGEQIALNVDGTTYEETNTYSAYVFIFTAKICQLSSVVFIIFNQHHPVFIYNQVSVDKYWYFLF